MNMKWFHFVAMLEAVLHLSDCPLHHWEEVALLEQELSVREFLISARFFFVIKNWYAVEKQLQQGEENALPHEVMDGEEKKFAFLNTIILVLFKFSFNKTPPLLSTCSLCFR